jgi:hypothetical protein
MAPPGVRHERAGLLAGAAALHLLRSRRSCHRLDMAIRDATHDIICSDRSVGGDGER